MAHRADLRTVFSLERHAVQLATTPRMSPKASMSTLRRARGFILASSIVLAGLCLAGPALANTTGTTGGLVSAASARAAAQCSGKFAMVNTGPSADVTYSSAFRWTRLAIRESNRRYGTAFTVVNTNVGSGTSTMLPIAQRLAANPDIKAIIGPQTSTATATMGPVFDANGLGYVSGSASRTSLTDGSLKNFFRVIPNDSAQAPALGRFVAGTLRPSRVVVIQQDDPYALGLADGLTTTLTSLGVATTRSTVALSATDYTDVIAQITTGDVVALAFLRAADANILVQQLHAAGKFPTLVGGDALYTTTFAGIGAYTTYGLPALDATKDGREAQALYLKTFHEAPIGGAGSFVAAQVVAKAARTACRNGVVSRQGLLAALPHTRLADSLMGQPVGFTARHDVINPRVHIFQLVASFDQVSALPATAKRLGSMFAVFGHQNS